MLACENLAPFEVIQHLILAGLDVNRKTKYGMTVLECYHMCYELRVQVDEETGFISPDLFH